MDFKKTLNMPNTKFDMKANLTQKEPIFQKEWEKNKIYQRVLEKNKNNPQFVLHDGPPYANGDLHVGHALNKILKDIIVRYKSMQGFYSPFVAGWDTHGLPIEHRMLEDSKLNRDKITPYILRKKAAKYAYKQIENQKKQFKALQLFSPLEDIYITMDKKFEAKQLELFKKMVFDNLVFKGLKPVYWSPSSESALAEAEVEYFDVVSPSVYVGFNVEKTDNTDIVDVGDRIVIWTTTPWTLIANAGVAVNQDFSYSKVKYKKINYIIATDLVEKCAKEFKWDDDYKIVKNFKGNELKGVFYKTPILNKLAPVEFGHHVTLDGGTGVVHLAPLFGEDDFIIGKNNKLEMIMHINDSGHIDYDCPFNKMFYSDANEKIIEFLNEHDLLVYKTKIKHSYPHDWRTHKPIMYRGTPQWFVSIDKIREKIVKEINNIHTYPSWAKKRLELMIKNRGDWTISRQRTWGVPIIIFYDKNNNPVLKEEIFDNVINLVRENGCDIWWEKTTDELLPEKYRKKGFTREMDIMDVWFDSGSTSISVDIPNIKLPFDLYLEGVDQYRGWFNSSMINSVAFRGISPYKNLISHGFVLDGKNEKMSKSKGNIISPLDVVKKRGADILRLWIANSEYSNDINISEQILDQNAEIYRKIRNTIRFLLGNLNGFKYENKIKREGVHLYVKYELEMIKAQVINAYDNFRFLNVIKILNNFIVNLSSFYLNVTKDILYIDKKNSNRRLQTLTNFYEITDFLILALAPIIPTTCEEAYKNFEKENKLESVMLEKFQKPEKVDQDYIDRFNEFFVIRDKVNILIENAIKSNIIKRSNEAHVKINSDSEFLRSLDLKQLLMVGKIEFGNEDKLFVFDSIKCLRCWNHYEYNFIKNELCDNCSKIIKK